MPFLLSDDEQLIQQVVGEFARDQITLDGASDLDRHDRYPADFLAGAAGLGLLGMTVPESHGGAGTSPTAYALAIHEVAKVCVNTATVLAMHNGLGMRLLLHGDAALAQSAAAGEPVAVLATEEAHGSDKATLGTEAVASDDGYRITGMKVWGIGASGAKHFVVLAQVPDVGPTLFHVPADAGGVQLGQNEALMGLRASGIRTVYLSDVAVPSSAVLGEAGQGVQLLAEAQPWLQIGVAAAVVGATRGAFAAAKEFAESRIQFNAPIGTYQAVSDGITEVDIQTSAAMALTLQAAAQVESPEGAAWAARAKAFAVEMGVPMTRQNIRIQGGTGFMREGGTERFARDVRALQFVGEPVHMQRDVLKRHLLDIEFEAAP
ncbi:MAG: acyl-CoA dehydrogenase family protein [Thermoplasmatota archaeon]